jgi:hypothetical protein
MSEDDTGHGTTYPDEGKTEEYPTIASALMTPGHATEDLAFDGDAEDEWPVRGPARGVRLALPTAGLVAVVLVAAGFWSGAIVQRNHGGSSAGGAGGAGSGFARFRSGQGGSTGTGTTTTGAPTFGGGGAGAGSSGTSGTISVVNGNTLYILTSAGALVKITLGPSTTITRNAKSQAVGIRPGDSVVVQGAASSKGDIAATSVSATAPGVSAGGFGGGRFGAGGTGGTAGTAGGGG